MASGSHYGGFFGGGYKIGFDWSSSRAGNENASNITVIPYLYIKSGYSISSSSQKSGTVNINGTNHNFNFTIGSVRGETWIRLASGFTTKVNHNSDGSKTCNLKVSATLNLNLSGSQIGTVSANTNVVLDRFNLNSAPTLGGSVSTTPASGYFSEKTTSIPVSWPAASDANGNLSNYYLEVSKNGGGWAALATLGSGTRSYNHSIPAAEGVSYQYRVRAKDSQNAYSGYISSNKITSNTLTGGAFTGTIPSISYGTTSFTMNFSGGKNSDGSSVKYLCYSDNITVYNQTETTGTSQVITIYKSGSTPSGPYIRFDDLKNYLRNSNYNGRLHIGLRTGNGRGTYKYNSASLSVDLRTNPGAPSSVVIQENSESTAYLTNAGTGNKYFIPDGSKTIKVKWSGGSNPLGGSFTYTVQQILNGNVSTVVSGLPSTTKEYSIKPAKLSGNSTATLAFRVQVVADYGNTAQKDSTQITLHSYNGVSFSQGSITRTATEATVNITIKTTSSVPNINTVGTWSCNGKSGNLTVSQAQQSFKITGLTEQGTYTATITYKDNTGWSSNQTASVSIGALAPIVAITKEGLGVGGVEANANAALNVKGNSNFAGKLQVNGNSKNVVIGTGGSDVYIHNSASSKYLQLKDDGTLRYDDKLIYHEGNSKGPVSGNWFSGGLTRVGTDGVMEIGKYLDFHNSNTTTADYDNRITSNGNTLEFSSNIKAAGSIYVRESRVATQASHGGLDLGGTDRNTTICSANIPTWWNGSTSYKIYTEGNKPTTADIGALGAKNANGYWGMTLPNKADNTWIRTTSSGILPYQNANSTWNGANSSLGTTAWRFANGYIKELYCNGLKNDLGDLWLSSKPKDSNATIYIQTKWLCPSDTVYTYLGSSGHRWHSVWASNGTIQTSDMRYKSDIKDVDNEVFYNMIKNTPVHTYVLNENRIDLKEPGVVPLTEETAEQEQIHLGIIAQELDRFEGAKYILNYDEESGYSVNNYNLTSAIMSALKHEISLREELEQENNKLKQEIDEIKQELAQIKQLLIK